MPLSCTAKLLTSSVNMRELVCHRCRRTHGFFCSSCASVCVCVSVVSCPGTQHVTNQPTHTHTHTCWHRRTDKHTQHTSIARIEAATHASSDQVDLVRHHSFTSVRHGGCRLWGPALRRRTHASRAQERNTHPQKRELSCRSICLTNKFLTAHVRACECDPSYLHSCEHTHTHTHSRTRCGLTS
jgi:hypothetical protein